MTITFKTLGLAAAVTLVTTVSAFAQTTLRFAHPVPESDPQHTMATFFADQLAERTNGEITVQIFPSGQLGNDAQMIDGVRSGIIDISLVGLNNLTGLMPQAGAFELPFMFPSRAIAYQVLDGAPGDTAAAEFENHGMKALGFPENGFRNMTNSRGPIRVPADVAGLQMRVNSSKALNDMFVALGAAPQQLPVAELYTALETGVVDSQDHPISVTLSFKFYEVQEYLSLTQHAYSALAFFMNLDKFNGMTAEQQQIIMDTAADAVAMQRELSETNDEARISELEANGMQVNRDVDAAAFQAATRSVWDNFVAENGDTMINAIAEASK